MMTKDWSPSTALTLGDITAVTLMHLLLRSRCVSWNKIANHVLVHTIKEKSYEALNIACLGPIKLVRPLYHQKRADEEGGQ